MNALLLGIGLRTFDGPTDELALNGFRSGLREMAQTKVIPAWLVFAAQNYLDIQHILKENTGRGVKELQTTCEITSRRVHQHVDFLEPLASLNGTDGDDPEWLRMYHRSFFSGTLFASQVMFYFHPIGAGLREFLTAAWLGQSSVERVANADIVGMAHLYHAAQLQTQSATWADMEFVIGTQTPEHMFFGGRPASFEQCCLKAELALGISIRNTDVLSSSPEDPILRSARRVQLLETHDIPFANILCARCAEPDIRDVERATENLQLVLNAALHGIDRSKFKQDVHGVLLNRAELLKLTSRKQNATLRELLATLEQTLTQKRHPPRTLTTGRSESPARA